ncbi:MAG: glycoside hydrolase, partial [Pseudomonadota bacterium]
MCSAYRRIIAIAVVGVLGAWALGDASAIARSLKDYKPHKGVVRAHSMPVQGIDVSYWQGEID